MDAEQKTKLMLLDDEHFLLDTYRIVFERSGYEVAGFDTADDALEALRAGYKPSDSAKAAILAKNFIPA